MSASRRLDLWTVVLVFAWAVIGALLLYPLSTVLRASLIDAKGQLSLANYVAVLGDPVYHRVILNTLLVGVGGMVGALLLGLTLAVLTTRYVVRGRALVTTLAVIALISPPFIGAYAWIILFGANGVVRRFVVDLGIAMPPIYGTTGVILVFALKFFPHVYLITAGAFANVNRSIEEAAESLGASPRARFFKVTLPMVLPATSAGALLTFVLSIADFGTPRMIGRDLEVLATEAFTLFSAEMGSNPGMASTVSLVLIAISMAVVLLQRHASRRNVYHGNMIARIQPRRLTGLAGFGVHAATYLIVALGALPAALVAFYSFRLTRGPIFRPGFGLQSYEKVLYSIPEVVTNTLVFSLISVAAIVTVGTLIGVLVARRRTGSVALLDGTLMIPYVIPGIVMGIAFIASFNEPPLVLTGTGAIIVLAVFIRRLPYAVRSSAAALRQVSPSLEEASVSLGYSPARTFLKVTVPLIMPGIIAGAMLSFVTAMNELSASLVLYVGSTMTMPVKIYLSVIDGEYGTAAALSTILVAVTAAVVYAALRVSGNEARALV